MKTEPKAEPTSGPWEVDGFNVTAVIKNEGSETWPQWKHICDCNYGYADPLKHLELNKANARLISAAPAMLSDLTEALHMLNDFANSGIKDSEYRHALSVLICRIKTDINKAKGL